MLFWRIVEFALLVYLLLLFLRAALSWVQLVKPDWRPRGAMLVLVEIGYTATDPPLRLASRFIKPVRIGPLAIDVSFMIVFFACWILLQIVGVLGR